MSTRLTVPFIRNLIRDEISRLVRIAESNSVYVKTTDPALKPSVRLAPGGGLQEQTDGVALSGAAPGGAMFGPTLTRLDTAVVWDSTDGTLTRDSNLVLLDESSALVLVTSDDVDMQVQPTAPTSDPGTDLLLYGGEAGTATANEDGGQVRIRGGLPTGSGVQGNVNITAPVILFTGQVRVNQNTFETGSEGSGTAINSAADTEITLDIQGATEVTVTGTETTFAGTVDTPRLAGMPITTGVTFAVPDGSEPLTVGAQADLRVEHGFEITDWYMFADQAGSVQIDIWKDTYANFPPTNADSMTGGNEPAIVAADKASSSSLSGWTTTTVADGDILRFNIDSASTITRATLLLIGTKS